MRSDVQGGETARGAIFEPMVLAVMKGELPAWPRMDGAAALFLDLAARQELSPLFHEMLRRDRTEAGAAWPEDVRYELRREAGRQGLKEAARFVSIQEALQAFWDEKIPVLVLKGTALAYSL